MDTLILIGLAVLGAVASAGLALIPALHIYNVAGLLILVAGSLSSILNLDQLALLLLGMVVGYSMLNTIPATFLAAPDESAAFIVLPAQKWLLQRRGYEAVVLTGVGGLGGLAVVVALSPFAGEAARILQAIVAPHLGWILLAVSAFMLMSEWPKAGERGRTRIGRFLAAWTGLGAGILTFFLSGLLGFIIIYRSVVPTEVAFQNLLPAFLGLFAVPMVLANFIMGTRIPEQYLSTSLDVSPSHLLRGIASGTLGGLFAAFFPVVTGGVGGFLAAHATAQRDDRTFILSQGASKSVYYVGGFLLFFVPGLHLARGGMAAMLSTIYTPATPLLYFTAVAAIAVSGAVSFLLLIALSRLAIRVVERVHYRVINAATLAILVTLVAALTGPGGLLIMLAATGIGLIPTLFGSRRMNCLGVLLLPITLNLLGLGPSVARLLGLI
ncbi:MAG TPA: tripartite tricarboxylate transporter permease [Anaerolineae bacterium]|nr:tripartite tricarboxylate transporter permease [Anaerolineae bacterium]